jgi:hypothetical protein
MALLTAEVTWLRWILSYFGISVTTPTTLLSNSICTYFGVDPSFFRVSVQDQVIALQYVPSESWRTSLRRHRLENNIVISLQTQCCGSTMSLRSRKVTEIFIYCTFSFS